MSSLPDPQLLVTLEVSVLGAMKQPQQGPGLFLSSKLLGLSCPHCEVASSLQLWQRLMGQPRSQPELRGQLRTWGIQYHTQAGT